MTKLVCDLHRMETRVRRIAFLFLLTPGIIMARPKALFYMTESDASVESFIQHASKIDLLVPTWYSVGPDGLVWGGPDELVMATARRAHVPIMPIIVNPAFDQASFHKFATSADAENHFIETLISECKKHGYVGFQFDFENVVWTDASVLTRLVADTAAALHKEGLQLTIATVPNAPGYPGKGGFAHWIYANWRGAYDLKALAESVDFVCLMTYDEHTRYTPPGPVAGYAWTLENLNYALQFVPKDKLSLGIPLYGYRWFAGDPGKGDRPSISAESIGDKDVKRLIETYHATIQWDEADRAAWFYFYRDQMREWVFYTDARTFRDRFQLVNAQGLAGFCSWVLGQEDPAIWDALPQR